MNLVERFRSEKIAVNCQTREEAEKFVKWCFDNGIKWFRGDENMLHWIDYCSNTCYDYENGYLKYYCVSGLEYYNYTIITYKDFFRDKEKDKDMKLTDLKPGQQVVKIRNGKRYLVLKNNIDSICLFGIDRSFALTGHYDNDMFCKDDNNKDIVAVYDIERSGFGLNLHHILKQGLGLKLVWKRKEDVKEMTLDEVNKILQDTKGFKVKIVE